MALPQTYKVIKGDQNNQPLIQEILLPKPSQNQVLVKMEFTPINPIDLLTFKNFYGDREAIGLEGSGVVVAIGDNLKISHKVGDKVHVVGRGTFAQYILAKSEDISPILQDDLSFEDAASHYINPSTVYYMGMVAEQGGHKAAIHTASSSALGKMLIRYFKHKGIKLINIVRRDEVIEELKKEGADYVLNSTAPDFEERLKELAEKENATISFDAIGGDFTNKVLKAQPPKSSLYIYGFLEGNEIKNISIPELFKGKSISALYLVGYVEGLSVEEAQRIYKETHKLLPTVLYSKIIKIFPLEQIKEALDYYLENGSKGKILLKLN